MKQLETNIKFELTTKILINQKYITESSERSYWETLPFVWKNIFWYNVRGQWRQLISEFERLEYFEKQSLSISRKQGFKKLIKAIKKSTFKAVPISEKGLKPIELVQVLLEAKKESWVQNFNQHYFFKSKLINKGDSSLEKVAKLQKLLTFSPKLHPTDDFIQELISSLMNIKTLDCKNENLENLAPVKELRKLRTITCSDNSLQTLEPLEMLPEIREIFCINSGIKSLDHLATSKKLTALYCGKNPIASLKALHELPMLKLINCRDTKIDKLEVALIKQKQPNCKVIWKRFLF